MAQGPPTDLKDKLATTAAAQQRGLAAQQAGKITTVAGWLTAPTTPDEIGRALPNGADPKRWVRIILTETRKNPGLLDADYRSFALAVHGLAQLGLEPGPLGHGYLTGPFQNRTTGVKEVVPILGYKGLMDLAYRSGHVDFIDAVVVRAGEPFRISRGSDYRLEHEELPSCWDHEVIAYYAIAFPRGSNRAVFEVMYPPEIEAIRKRSRAKDNGPWQTDFEAMALKTPIRRMVNRGKVRLSAEAAAAFAEDEAREFGYDRPEAVDMSAYALQQPPNEAGGSDLERAQADARDAGKAAAKAPRRRGDAKDEQPPLAEPDGTTAASTEPQAEGKGDPTKDPAAPGSILRDTEAPQPQRNPSLDEDPGRAFRQQPKEGGK